MAKMIPYKADTNRKLGFRKAKRDPIDLDASQLNLFREEEGKVQMLRHLNPFEKALELDDEHERLAEKLYREAIRSGHSVADSYCNLGIIYARKGETAKAIDSFTNALVNNPRHTEAHYNLANMYYDAGNYSLAVTHYEVALHLEDVFEEVVYNLALAHLSLDNRERALEYLQKYAERDPEDLQQTRRLISLLRQ